MGIAELTNDGASKIAKLVNEGATPDKAVNLAVDGVYETNLGTFVAGDASDRLLNGIGVAADPNGYIGMRTWYLERKWRGDEMNLSTRIHNNITNTKKDIVSVIRRQLRTQKSWQATATQIARTGAIGNELSGYITDLEYNARKLIENPNEVREYRKALSKTKDSINRMVKADAASPRLRKAYQNLVRATEKRSTEALDKAITRVSKAKLSYNAQRISRTEIARAYGYAEGAKIAADPDAVGVQWALSARHPLTDICDVNIGPYPKNRVPHYPAHPHCLCQITPVYENTPETDSFDPNRQANKLAKMSDKDRKKILGIKGNQAFQKDRKTWSKYARNYRGNRPLTEPRVVSDVDEILGGEKASKSLLERYEEKIGKTPKPKPPKLTPIKPAPKPKPPKTKPALAARKPPTKAELEQEQKLKKDLRKAKADEEAAYDNYSSLDFGKEKDAVYVKYSNLFNKRVELGKRLEEIGLKNMRGSAMSEHYLAMATNMTDDEALGYLKKRGIKVDDATLKILDREVLDGINASFAHNNDIYGDKLSDIVEEFKVENFRRKALALGGNKKVILHSDFRKKNTGNFYRGADDRENWLTVQYTGTIKESIDHEIGHNIHFKTNMKKINSFFRKTKRRNVKSSLSTYASTNSHEFFAESWAMSLNAPNPLSYVQEITADILAITKK